MKDRCFLTNGRTEESVQRTNQNAVRWQNSSRGDSFGNWARLPAMGARSMKGQWLSQLVFALDRGLRRRQGIFEYVPARECVFRIQRIEANRHLRLKDGTDVSPGDPVLALHIWNENIPAIGDEGPTVAWGRRLGRAMDSSLEQLACFLRHCPDFKGVSAFRMDMATGTAERNRLTVRILGRYGFEPAPVCEGKPAGYFRRLGENIWVLLLILAANRNAARASIFRRERAVVYLSRAALDRRYSVGAKTR